MSCLPNPSQILWSFMNTRGISWRANEKEMPPEVPGWAITAIAVVVAKMGYCACWLQTTHGYRQLQVWV